MAKFTGLADYCDKRDVWVEQEGAHVALAVEATSGSNRGEAMITPHQARAIADELRRVADDAERHSGVDFSG